MTKLIIDAMKNGYSTNQVGHTLLVGDLIEVLQQFDSSTPVYLGFNQQNDGSWCSYGAVRAINFNEVEEDEEHD